MYYTPSVQEFFTGFRYETEINNKWVPKIYNGEKLRKKVRVKSLCKQDLFELEFEQVLFNDSSVAYSKRIVTSTSNNELLLFFLEADGIQLHLDNRIILNYMFVKNKQELEFLLNRMGLII